MAKFSERYGYTTPSTVIQLESMDEQLRTEIWNVIYETYFNWEPGIEMAERLCYNFFRQYTRGAADEYYGTYVKDLISEAIRDDEFYLVYDIVESAPKWAENESLEEDYYREMNKALALERSGFRFVSGVLTEISSPEELEEVASAIEESPDAPAHHLKRALEFYADRVKPDYVASVVQSIHAVESLATTLSGEKDLPKAFDALSRSGLIDDHKAIVRGWKAIYGYTSDKDGFRHGGVGVPAIDQAYARYFLITCSAMVNLLRSLAANKAKGEE